MSHDAPLKPQSHLFNGWNTWLLFIPISVLIAMIIAIKVRIRRLIRHPVLPR